MSVSNLNMRKDKAKPKDAGCRSKSSNRSKEVESKAKKLFAVIETFHNSLCSLPLNLLISNNHPDQWLHEQTDTLQQLQKRLKEQKSSSQADYYKVKLESVGVVLRNIKDNVEMLNKFKESIQYSSNQSNASSSRVSEHQGDAFLCHKYEINPNSDRNEQHSSRFQFPTTLDTLKSEDEEESMDANEVYEKELNKFQKNVSQIKTKRILASEENNAQLMNSVSLHMSTKGTVRNGRLLTSDTLQKHSSMTGSEVCFETQQVNHAKEIQSLKSYY